MHQYLRAQSSGYPPISELTTVPFDHPNYLTLLELADSYGCAIKYTDGTPVGTQPLTSAEYYAALSHCEMTLLANGNTPQADLNRLYRLMDEFVQPSSTAESEDMSAAPVPSPQG